MSKTKKKKTTTTKTYKFTTSEAMDSSNIMAEFNYKLLKKFKKAKRYGYPGDIYPEADTPEKWEALIDQFIKTFKRIRNDFDDSPINKALNKLYKEHPEYLEIKGIKQKDGTYIKSPAKKELLSKYVTQKVIEKDKKYYQKINNNLQLFGKYFLHFWE